jgi:hypothetical protein
VDQIYIPCCGDTKVQQQRLESIFERDLLLCPQGALNLQKSILLSHTPTLHKGMSDRQESAQFQEITVYKRFSSLRLTKTSGKQLKDAGIFFYRDGREGYSE